MGDFKHGCESFRRGMMLSRRGVLQSGLVGAASLSMVDWWRAMSLGGEASPLPGFGRAKRCILLFMWGGPSHLDTWDPKPDAPAEIRGEFKAISTSVEGTFISEHFPQIARRVHQLAIVRSMTHDDVAHLSSAHHLLTGQYAPKRFSDADPPSSRDTPHIGSVLSHLHEARSHEGQARVGSALPTFVSLPWIVSHPAAPGGKAPGQHGGWLGRSYDPFLVGDPNDPNFRIAGIASTPDSPIARLATRKELLGELEQGTAPWGSSTWRDLASRAADLILDPRTQQAFDLNQEPSSVRDRYGRHTHGQSVLLARRLVEAGVPLVTVNWHNDGQSFWDTHGNNFKRLKDQLMPAADGALSALLDDLASRGLLDETLVVWVGEFGRKPLISSNVAGREHWARCYSAALAGGGIRGGMVYGESDRHGAYPSQNPVSPSDLCATMYHALGIPAETTLIDQQGVPKHLVTGTAIQALFAG
jgi:hypothetical protein